MLMMIIINIILKVVKTIFFRNSLFSSFIISFCFSSFRSVLVTILSPILLYQISVKKSFVSKIISSIFYNFNNFNVNKIVQLNFYMFFIDI